MDGAPQSPVAEVVRSGTALIDQTPVHESGTHPFDTVEWELRDARIGHGDRVAFEQQGVEFPKSWSQNATNIVAQKYFRGQLGSPERESSVKEMISRVAGTITGWGRAGGYFAAKRTRSAFNHELTYILLNQLAAFNSPVWFNVGFEESPQCSACFILSVDDTMESILDWNTKEGMIFRGGSGSGINLSNIRGSMEPLAKGGTASGPVSFMRGADSWAGTIKSGGKTRRAAKMVVLDVDHPDIREFIWCKAKEEDKAAALRDAGFDMSIDGDGFKSIQYQNANNSVRVTDEFMRAVEEDGEWQLTARTTGEPVGEPIPARELMREIAEAAWRCADPGVQYDTTINQWHTSPNSGRINASNPCSEYMHVDNSACNLASLNLMKFRRADGTLDVRVVRAHGRRHAARAGDRRRALQLPDRGDRAERARLPPARPRLRQPRRLPDEQRHALRLRPRPRRRGGDHRADDRPRLPPLGGDRGRARALRPLRGEPRAAQQRDAHAPRRLLRDPRRRPAWTRSCWRRRGARGTRRWSSASSSGYRNAQATVLAPTGTISFLMDCDTTGVEPDFSLVKFKELVGGGQMTIVNKTVPLALQTLGYSEQQVEQIEAHLAEHGTIVGAPGLNEEHLPVFDVAVGERAISHMGHLKMMGAVQPFISGAISKTVNMPQEATVEDIADAYTQAWHLGVKALAIYRDGSKTAQALRTDAQQGVTSAPEPVDVDAIVEAGRQQGAGRGGPAAQADAARAPIDHAQVLDRRPRGLHHRRHVRGRLGRGDLPHRHRQGGLDAARHDELVRDGDLDRAAVRRAARDARAEVQLHALRAGGDHRQPGDPVRQVDARLHHALAGLALPGRGHPGGAGHPHAGRARAQSSPGRRAVGQLLRHRQPGQRQRHHPETARRRRTRLRPSTARRPRRR